MQVRGSADRPTKKFWVKVVYLTNNRHTGLTKLGTAQPSPERGLSMPRILTIEDFIDLLYCEYYSQMTHCTGRQAVLNFMRDVADDAFRYDENFQGVDVLDYLKIATALAEGYKRDGVWDTIWTQPQ